MIHCPPPLKPAAAGQCRYYEIREYHEYQMSGSNSEPDALHAAENRDQGSQKANSGKQRNRDKRMGFGFL